MLRFVQNLFLDHLHFDKVFWRNRRWHVKCPSHVSIPSQRPCVPWKRDLEAHLSVLRVRTLRQPDQGPPRELWIPDPCPFLSFGLVSAFNAHIQDPVDLRSSEHFFQKASVVIGILRGDLPCPEAISQDASGELSAGTVKPVTQNLTNALFYAAFV